MAINSSNVTWATVSQSDVLNFRAISQSAEEIWDIRERRNSSLFYDCVFALISVVGAITFFGMTIWISSIPCDVVGGLSIVGTGCWLYTGWKNNKARKIIEEDNKGDYQRLRVLFQKAEQEIALQRARVDTLQSVN